MGPYVRLKACENVFNKAIFAYNFVQQQDRKQKETRSIRRSLQNCLSLLQLCLFNAHFPFNGEDLGISENNLLPPSQFPFLVYVMRLLQDSKSRFHTEYWA